MEVSFSPKENSNHEIMFYDGHKEIVSYEQLKNLIRLTTDSQIKLLAINSGLFAVSDIRRILPTNKKTPSEILEKEKKVVTLLKDLKIKNWSDFTRYQIEKLKGFGIDIHESHKGSGKDIFNRYKNEIISNPKELE